MIGEVLKLHRESQKLTKADLEMMTCVSVDTIRRIESGNAGVALGSVCAIIEALRLEVWIGRPTRSADDAGALGAMVALSGVSDDGACANRPRSEIDRPGETRVQDSA